MVMVLHNVERGVRRLLTAPRDLPASVSWQEPHIAIGGASSKHQQLFNEYSASLEIAVGTAVKWWEGLIKARMKRGLSQEVALKEVDRSRLAGPVSNPEVVYVIRKYWLACVALNAYVHEPQVVPPEVFLLQWLVDEERELLVQVLSGMLYWPIGLDDDGHWC